MAQVRGEVEGLDITPLADSAEDRRAAADEINDPISLVLVTAISRIERNQPKAALAAIHDAFWQLKNKHGFNGDCSL